MNIDSFTSLNAFEGVLGLAAVTVFLGVSTYAGFESRGSKSGIAYCALLATILCAVATGLAVDNLFNLVSIESASPNLG